VVIPQRADMVLERCTNAVASPFGVTGALINKKNCLKSTSPILVVGENSKSPF